MIKVENFCREKKCSNVFGSSTYLENYWYVFEKDDVNVVNL